jgi:histidinol-phosphatase
MSDPSLSDLLDVATEAAYLAGRRTLAYFNTPISIDTKSDNTPVTIADHESEQIIRQRIIKSFPDHTILGEETGQSAGNPDFRWIIDPIDGTKTFVQGVPLYGVLIGLEVRKQPVVGVIYMPALDEMVTAAQGEGCRWNGRPARVTSTDRLDKAFVCISDMRMAEQRGQGYANLVKQSRLQRTWGDCYGYVLVATGRADVMIDPKLSPWDCAAIIPIIHEAGGKFTSWAGAEGAWVPDGIATTGLLHRQVMDVLNGP